MFSRDNKIEIGRLLVILVIILVIIFSVFYYFNFINEEGGKEQDISQIINKEEIQKTEVDIAEIERRLDELDIDLDDLLRELEL